MTSGMFWTLLLLGDFPYECLGELLTARATCLDLGVGQILTTIIVNLFILFLISCSIHNFHNTLVNYNKIRFLQYKLNNL